MASLLGLRPRHPLHVAAVLVDWRWSDRLFLRLVELDGRVAEAALRVAQVAARYRRVEVDLVLGRGRQFNTNVLGLVFPSQKVFTQNSRKCKASIG